MPNRKPHDIDVHVGERLKTRRSLLRISQEKLADAVGITFQQVQKYESGANRISASRLWQFSKILNVSIAYFFESFSEGSDPNAELYAGLSDNKQDEFTLEENVMESKETIELIREYYSIKDPKVRKQMLDMIKTFAAKSPSE